MKNLKIFKYLGAIILLSAFLLPGSLLILGSLGPNPVQAAANPNDADKLLKPVSFQQGDTPPCDCSPELSCFRFRSKQDAQACYDYCVATTGQQNYPKLDSDGDRRACESSPNATPTPTPTPPPDAGLAVDTPEFAQTPGVEPTQEPTPTPLPPVPVNLVRNGNFEAGFYPVPELGFEPPDTGQVPFEWNWYRNQAYGKYTINNNQTFGLTCPFDTGPAPAQEDDSPFGPIPGYVAPPSSNTLALHMQSTDEMDARLGVYQTLNVVPGQDYRFSMSATIQVQAGARTLEPLGPAGFIPQAPNHTFELYFDHTGNTDWRAIPFQKWTNVPIPEEKLFFSVEETEKEGESALAVITNYQTIVKARSNKMTIFITGWRKWANWRTSIFNIDCVWLTPVDAQGRPILYAQPAAGDAQPAALSELAAAEATPFEEEPPAAAEAAPSEEEQPAAAEAEATPVQQEQAAEMATPSAGEQPAEEQSPETPAEESAPVIPSSGGILEEKGNVILIIVASAIVIIGLVGAGIWNMRR